MRCHLPPASRRVRVAATSLPPPPSLHLPPSTSPRSFLYYDAVFSSVTPRATPLGGGTRFLVRGENLAQFAVGTQTGAYNIYGVPSQVRSYQAYPTCFIGGPQHAVPAALENCYPVVDGWAQGDESNGQLQLSGCQMLRCMPAPAMDAEASSLPFSVSLNGQVIAPDCA